MSSALLASAPAWVNLSASVIRMLPCGRYRLLHWIGSRHARNEFVMKVPPRFGGFTFRCNLQDTISREVCFTGQYEPQETALVKSILKSGTTFVDVGANWGYFTLLASSLVGRRGTVISLEPDPRLFLTLTENVARSGTNHVTLLQVAAAATAGKLSLSGYDNNGENFGLSRIVSKTHGAENVYEVLAERLDVLLDNLKVDSVDLLKMDIEGAEAFALSGLEGSLKQRRIKRLMLELHPTYLAEHGSTPLQAVTALKEAGYKALKIDHSASATRRLAYGRTANVLSILHPFTSFDELDAWPHILWEAPGVKPILE